MSGLQSLVEDENSEFLPKQTSNGELDILQLVDQKRPLKRDLKFQQKNKHFKVSAPSLNPPH
jgi:hypothetical protein